MPPTPNPFRQGKGRRARPIAGKAARASAGPKTKAPRQKPGVADDEEPVFVEATKISLSPEEEFRERLAERHHQPLFDVDACLANVRRQLEKSGGLSFADFLAYDRAKTT